jgi:ABC-type Fe3+-hydroxamate transport system substrate-binding protein
VLASASVTPHSAAEAISRQGIPVLETTAPDLPGVLDSIEAIADRLGLSGKGRLLAGSLRRRMEAVAARVAGRPRLRALLLIWPDPPQAAGEGTFAGDLLRRAGAENVVRRPGWPVVSLEFLLARGCDVVVYPSESDTSAAFTRAFREGPLGRMPAVLARRRIGIDAGALLRPGPRSFQALETLVRRLAGFQR